MRTTKLFTLLAGIVVAMLLTGCGSGARKMKKVAEEYQQKGMSIIGYGDSIIYFHDGSKVYWKNINSEKTYVLVETNKEYDPIRYYSLLQPGEKQPGIHVLDVSDYEGSDVAFKNFDGFTMSMIDENFGVVLDGWDKGSYVFLRSNPSRPINCSDGYNSMPKAAYEDMPNPPFYITLCGNLWDYGKESPAIDDLPKISRNYVSENVLKEWDGISYKAARDPFEYWTEVELLADGTLNKNNYGIFYFSNIGKMYCAAEIVDGDMFSDVIKAVQDSIRTIKERMQREREAEIIEFIRSQAIEIDEIGNMYRNNPMRAKELYPVGRTYIIDVTLDNIKETYYSNYQYVMEHEGYSLVKHFFYSNDGSFVNFAYPKHVYVRAKLLRIDRDSYIDELYPIFVNTELLMW